MTLVDYHVHTARCGHASGELKDYLQKAREAGLGEIGFADHLPMYFLPVEERDPGIAMAEEKLPDYVQEVMALKAEAEKMGGTVVRLGIEADYVPGHEEKLRQLLRSYPFDYVIGSVHFLDGWGFDNLHYLDGYERWDIDELYEYYFQRLMEAAGSGFFHIMAHPDLIKKFNFRPRRDMKELYRRVAKVFREAGVCAEVNTAGLRVPAKEIYPAYEFLVAFCEVGVPVTLGSDAHRPEDVGYAFEQALRLIKEAGYREIVTFRDGKKFAVRI